MLKGSAFAETIVENEVLLSKALQQIYQTANAILCSHPLFQYFEEYLGGYLIITDSAGKVLSWGDDETLTSQKQIGYIHPVVKDQYYQNAIMKAESLLGSDYFRSYDSLDERAGALRIQSGLIFSFSGFEFLEIKEASETDTYEDIFETINLYTLLTSDFFETKSDASFKPHQFSFEKNR